MKNTKKALLLSAMALLLCCTMLVGTTFAWFTDSVTSGNNIIAAGNLDIQLEYTKTPADGNSWASVEGATELFSTQKWEPGHTEVVYFRMTNAGTLNLNYQLGININGEIAGKNVAGESFNLSDYILFGVKDGQSDAFADRAAAVAAVSDSAKKLKEGYTEASSMAPGAVSNFALVVYMPETVGNEANYRETAPSIDLGVTLLATQKTAENDSFGSDYDAAANGSSVVTTAQELADALANGKTKIAIKGNITLTNGLNASNVTFTGVDENAGINFNGHNIAGSGSITYQNLKLTTVSLPYGPETGERYGWYGGIDYLGHSVANYENCTITGVFTTYSQTVNATGCTFNSYVQDGEEYYNIFLYRAGTVNATNCTFLYRDRAIKVYSEGPADFVLNIKGGQVVATGDYSVNKAIINVDSTYLNSAEINIEGLTIDSKLAAAKLHNAEGNAKVTVTVK